MVTNSGVNEFKNSNSFFGSFLLLALKESIKTSETFNANIEARSSLDIFAMSFLKSGIISFPYIFKNIIFFKLPLIVIKHIVILVLLLVINFEEIPLNYIYN